MQVIDNFKRRYPIVTVYLLAMVSKLDESVGEITEALNDKNMLQNTIIVFTSDNGAPTIGPGNQNWGSNFPLRGLKDTLFEGEISATLRRIDNYIRF